MPTNKKTQRVIPEILEGKTYLDPKYDPAFRALFEREDALIDFLNGLLHLEKEKQIEHLEYTFADTLRFRTPEPKAVIFDIRATTKDHRFLDIEMQRATHSFFTDRVLLYGSFLTIKGNKSWTSHQNFSP